MVNMRILYLPNSHCQQRQFEKPNFLAYPVRLAMEAQYYRNIGHDVWWIENRSNNEEWFSKVKNWWLRQQWNKIITKPENLSFLSLPHPDRVWTNAADKNYQANGNFKYHPGTYIQSASGCWHGACSFCVEQGQKYEVRPVEDVISEIEEIKAQNYREVFDDSATFPTGEWLSQFCDQLVRRKLGIRLGCNMRMVDVDYKSLRNAGFRMLLFGLESANPDTLLRINKGVKIEDIKYIKKAAEAGLEPHVAVMFGYPWETDQDAVHTLRTVHYLLKKGYAKTAQASFYTPKVGQDSYGEPNYNQRVYVRRVYDIKWNLEFWFNKLRDIHDVNDLNYLWRQMKAGMGWL